MTTQLRIGALISGGGTNLQAIIDACATGQVDGQIVFVGSDNPHAKGLDRASKAAIATFVVDYGRILRRCRESPDPEPLPAGVDLDELARRQRLHAPNNDPQRLRRFLHGRVQAEATLLAAMAPYPFDLLVLAGFMRNLTPYFIDRINTEPGRPRIMNIHPALLPAFPGTDGYGDTFCYGCKVGGCTVHFIDYGEDSGPIIGQRAFAIGPNDDLETVRRNGLAQEWQLYPECIQLFAEGRLRVVEKNHTLDNGPCCRRSVVEILDR